MESEIIEGGIRLHGYDFISANPYQCLVVGRSYAVFIHPQEREVGEQQMFKMTFWDVPVPIKDEDMGIVRATLLSDFNRDWGEVKVLYNDGSTVTVENLHTGVHISLNYGVAYTDGHLTNRLN